MKTICYSAAADKTLAKMPANTAALIESKIDQLAIDPASLGNLVKRLQGSQAFRLRVGDWRVVYTDELVILDILAIAPRGAAY
ncbi:MAG: hypothetical protein RL367_48 [Pseudomonadota bacterium]